MMRIFSLVLMRCLLSALLELERHIFRLWRGHGSYVGEKLFKNGARGFGNTSLNRDWVEVLQTKFPLPIYFLSPVSL